MLRHDARHVAAHNAMAHLLGFEGRSWEAVPHLLEPVRQRQFNLNHLLLLGRTDPIVHDAELWARYRAAETDYFVLMIAAARRILFAERNRDEAESMLRHLVRTAPHQMEAQVRLGALLVESGEAEQVVAWHAALPAAADRHPRIWMVRGRWAERRDGPRAAARCFWEALQLNPDHQAANYQLGQALTALERGEEAGPFLLRAELLSELSDATSALRTDRRNQERMHQAAQLCEQLGRLWEAWGWYRVAADVDPRVDWPQRGIVRLSEIVERDLPRTIPAANSTGCIDLNVCPLSKLESSSGKAGLRRAASAPDSAIQFADVARENGLTFRYFNGAERNAQTNRMFEQNGGGVAAFDFDLDGRPDLYFTQGCRWPPGDAKDEFRDRLYRIQAVGGFRDVTRDARLGSKAFGQRIAAGDFNNDGFVDLYVANIGANWLYVNNGDGTFSDVTAENGMAGDEWTAS